MLHATAPSQRKAPPGVRLLAGRAKCRCVSGSNSSSTKDSRSNALSGRVLRLLTAPNCCYRGRRGGPKWYVSFSNEKVVCSVLCQFISNYCFCRNPTTLQIGNTHEYAVRRQMCCLSRASGVVVAVVSGPSMVSVVFRLVRSLLFCNSGF